MKKKKRICTEFEIRSNGIQSDAKFITNEKLNNILFTHKAVLYQYTRERVIRVYDNIAITCMCIVHCVCA